MGSRVGELHRSQLITTFGIGSIYDALDFSLTVAGLDFWKIDRTEEIREERLEKKLGVDRFRRPKVSDNPGDANIPCFRFPKWVFCPKCKTLAHYNDFGGVEKKICESCSSRRGKHPLVPARLVVACRNGHIDDFPWSWWVHKGADCDKPRLKISSTGRSTALSSVVVMCKTCDARRSLGGIFGKGGLAGTKCFGKRPWLRDKERCDLSPEVLQRGSASVYFPVIESAISIPPFSNRLNSFLRQHETALKYVPAEALSKAVVELLARAGEKMDPALVIRALREREGFFSKEDSGDLRAEEYLALSYPGKPETRGDFCARAEKIPPPYSLLFSRVVLVDRLREVSALVAFNRIDPNGPMRARISREDTDWLPGMEVRGEGIFIELDANAIERWKQKQSDFIAQRIGKIEKIRKALKDTGFWVHDTPVTPEFVLIHTLSHLLILRLTIDCGYSSSSLRERLYVGPGKEGSAGMHGLLIYTATTDSEGSLGGLVRQGLPARFSEVLAGAIEQARWCSGDPLCIESDGQGLNSLNLAACHTCALLPETACELRNCYLDRGLLIGRPDRPEAGFFSATP